jgi:hypothetical protein
MTIVNLNALLQLRDSKIGDLTINLKSKYEVTMIRLISKLKPIF